MTSRPGIPESLLVAVMLLVGVFVSRYSPHTVPDTLSYSQFPLGSLTSALNNSRTPGYPLLLAGVRMVSADYAALPLIQYAIWCLAVCCFWCGLGSMQIGRAYRAWICIPLLFADVLHRNVDTIATDSVASATCVALVGCLIRFVSAEQFRLRLVLVISALCLAACLIRPASLFLIVFVPGVGAILAANWRAGLQRGALLLGAVSAPVLGYCLLRWLVIGQFGLVSFGGQNLIGIAGQWLDESAITKLSNESQPLARLALKRQIAWERDHPLRPDQNRQQYLVMEERYDPYIWFIFEPAAREHFQNDPARVNSGLRQLAQELIRIAPRNYLIWLGKASRQAIRVVAVQLASNPFVILCALVWGAGELTRLRPGCKWQCDVEFPKADRFSATILLIAGLFLVLSTGLIVLVCTPIGRLMDAAAVFVPLVFADRATRTWRRLSLTAAVPSPGR
jgi:hypothetical protein